MVGVHSLVLFKLLKRAKFFLNHRSNFIRSKDIPIVCYQGEFQLSQMRSMQTFHLWNINRRKARLDVQAPKQRNPRLLLWVNWVIYGFLRFFFFFRASMNFAISGGYSVTHKCSLFANRDLAKWLF
jgi:hypothetical protein